MYHFVMYTLRNFTRAHLNRIYTDSVLGHYYMHVALIDSVHILFCNVAVSSVLDEQAFIWSVTVELQPNIITG